MIVPQPLHCSPSLRLFKIPSITEYMPAKTCQDVTLQKGQSFQRELHQANYTLRPSASLSSNNHVPPNLVVWFCSVFWHESLFNSSINGKMQLYALVENKFYCSIAANGHDSHPSLGQYLYVTVCMLLGLTSVKLYPPLLCSWQWDSMMWMLLMLPTYCIRSTASGVSGNPVTSSICN